MVGQKGRSGRRPGQASPLQQAHSQKAAAKGGGTSAIAGDIGDDPEVEKRIKRLGLPAPKTWAEAKVMEQTRAEIYRTISASVQLKEARRVLVHREELDHAAELVRDILHRHLERVPRQVADSVEARPEIRAQVRTAAEDAIAGAFAEAINEASGK